MQRRTSSWLVSGLVVASSMIGAHVASAGSGGTLPTAAADRWSGGAAVQQLGSRLPSVAAVHGLAPSALRELFRTDETLFVDGTDRLLYVEPLASASEVGDDHSADRGSTVSNEGAVSSSIALTPFDGSIAASEAFSLQSRPGANRVIFVDFDGHSITGSAWASSAGGDCYAEPFDTDGSPTTFSTSEREAIISVWRRMSEDYAPFDVNVTTMDPGYAAINRASSSDAQFGTRLLVTKSVSLCPNGKTFYNSVCSSGCGGVAYVGVYDNTGTSHDYYQPALVFQNGTGSSAKSIAEAASHEVGHNIGLSHDGTTTGAAYYYGHGSWAPIMGVGYNRAIVQWSRGEYANANQTQDDFVVAGSNGMPLRTDDHGNTAAAATVVSGFPTSVSGVISTRSDVDAFTVSVNAGQATFTAAPLGVSPNLDIRLELRDATGALVASDDPASGSSNGDVSTGMGASISVPLAAGQYTVLVDGVGAGDPLSTGYSDYASVGHFLLSIDAVGPDGSAPTAVATASTLTGRAPLPVTFTGSGSTDPMLGALTYAWDFGDGGSSTEADPTYTFAAAGTYTVVLTVTNEAALVGRATLTVTVSAPLRAIDVAAMTISGTRAKSGASATATVTVRDASSALVNGASVTGTWYVGTKVGATRTVTTTNGIASFSSGNLKVSAGTVVRFCVTALSLSGGVWDAGMYTAGSGDCVSWTVG